MRLHRFYINQVIGEEKEITLTDPELIHQLANVFRFKSEDQVIMFDGSGLEYISEIISLTKKELVVKILSYSAKAVRDVSISLYLSLIKKNNFELAVEKCTEIGVNEIHPVISERSEKKDLNLERLNKIVKEASEQSGRVTLPRVFDIKSLEESVTQAISEGKVCVTFHTDSESSTAPNPSLQDQYTSRFLSTEYSKSCDLGPNPNLTLSKVGIDGCHKVATFVGPEGGWTEAEMELFKKNNFKIYSLGQNILRAETAAIVAVWSQINN